MSTVCVCSMCNKLFESAYPDNLCEECSSWSLEYAQNSYVEGTFKTIGLAEEKKQETALYTNTYLVFRKLMNEKRPGEALSECIREVYKQSGLTREDFMEMSSSVASGFFAKKKELCYSALCKEIQKIYEEGAKNVLEQSGDEGIKFVEVSYQGYLYAFVEGSREYRKPVILTDFYTTGEKVIEDSLFTGYKGSSYVQQNQPVHYRKVGNYYLINTYNGFCNYADYLGNSYRKGFNEIMFQGFLEEHGGVLGLTEPMNIEQVNDRTKSLGFRYVQFKNAIIIYDFQVPINCKLVKITKVEDGRNEAERKRELAEARRETEYVYKDLRESYAFADEGIFPIGDCSSF